MTIYTERTGDGQPLILIHGMGSAATTWRPLTPFLRHNFEVIALDLPGHGHTPLDPHQAMDPQSLAELVLRTLDELQIDQAHIAGNSLGGWIALEMAALAPDRVRSLTALAPAGLWLTPYTSRIPGSAPTRLLARGSVALAPSLLKKEWARKIGFGAVSPKWRELDFQTCLDAATAMGTSTGYFPAWDALLLKRFDKEISPSVPTTIIFGDSDNTLPVRTCQERSLAPAHAKWIVLPESGHAPMWDHPVEVAQEIITTAGIR
jgi:pimeloyl-ACP methyl ester carboxylesterase